MAATPAIKISGTAAAMSEPTRRAIGVRGCRTILRPVLATILVIVGVRVLQARASLN
jgi:hypothetical protein